MKSSLQQNILLALVIFLAIAVVTLLWNLYSLNNTEITYVYEEEAESAEYCTDFEEYDTKHGVCYVECNSEEECEEINQKIDEELEALEAEYKKFSKAFNENIVNAQELEEDAELVYRLEPNEIFTVILGEENSQHIKVKKWLAAISPNNFSDSYLSRVISYKNQNSDILAYVAPLENSVKWDMYVNMSSFNEGEKEVVFTLIHEFSHILTLNSQQVDADITQENCLNHFIQEGCLNENSYLNQFYKKFWQGKFKEDALDFYENYDLDPSSFVTEYASTNSAEDIAESIASFMISKTKENQTTVAEQKLAFFYKYPELVKIRDSIRIELKSFIRKKVLLNQR